MSEFRDDPGDPLVAQGLRSALEEIPSGLLPRLERVAAAGLRPGPDRRATPLWLELAPQVTAVALLFAFVAILGSQLTSPGALALLALPLAVLFGFELVRGAPLIRAWLR